MIQLHFKDFLFNKCVWVAEWVRGKDESCTATHLFLFGNVTDICYKLETDMRVKYLKQILVLEI